MLKLCLLIDCTCILADESLLCTLVFIIPTTRRGLEIEGKMVLVTLKLRKNIHAMNRSKSTSTVGYLLHCWVDHLTMSWIAILFHHSRTSLDSHLCSHQSTHTWTSERWGNCWWSGLQLRRGLLVFQGEQLPGRSFLMHSKILEQGSIDNTDQYGQKTSTQIHMLE